MKRTTFILPDTIQKQLLSDALGSNGFLLVNKILIQKLGLVDAAILSNYVNKFKYWSKQINFTGLFYLTYEQQQQQLNISIYSLRLAKKRFFDLGLIEIVKQGTPAKEYYRLKIEKIIHFVYMDNTNSDPSNTGGQDLSNTGGQDPSVSIGLYNKNKNNKNKNNKIYISSSDSSQEKEEQFLPLAIYLSKIIQKKKNINHTKNQLSSWAKSIRLLAEQNKISIPRIKKALKWYYENIGAPYVPEIESGASLRDKFLKLENAMSRDTNNLNKTQKENYDPGTWHIDHTNPFKKNSV